MINELAGDINVLEYYNILSPEVQNNYDIFLIDMCGVITDGVSPYQGAVENINKLSENKEVYFMSNIPKSLVELFKTLSDFGINTSEEKIISSGQVAIDLIKNLGNPLIYCLGTEQDKNIWLGKKFNFTDHIQNAEIILLTLFLNQEYDLEKFDPLLKTAAQLNKLIICVSPDIIRDVGTNNIYCPGYFAKKIEEFGGSVTYTGKPYKTIYETIFEKHHNIDKNRILMIGDTIENDILGAHNACIHSALVLTGNTLKFHKGYRDFNEKLKHISDAVHKSGIIPNFITNLSYLDGIN